MNDPIRVAQIMGKMKGGGVEAFVMNYFRHIDRERLSFDFIVDEDSTYVPEKEIEALGGRVFYIPPYQKPLAYQKALQQLLLDHDWKIVHSHVNSMSMFPLYAAKKVGVPVRIAHSHSTSGKGEHLKNIAKWILKKLSNLYPTHRLACSEAAGKWLFGEHADFTVIYNAIDLDHYDFDENIRLEVRSELDIPDDKIVVGHIGRFMTQKNHTFLIEMFKEVSCRREDMLLICVGDGKLKADMEKLVSNLDINDKVLFLGQRSDANKLYQAFDVFVLPSLYEGLGMVAIEAQRSGLPCLLSDEVPKEVDITGTVEFLPLSNVNLWVETLSEIKKERLIMEDEAFSQYNIADAASKLTDLYISLNRMDFNEQ